MNELRTGKGTIIRYGENIRSYHDDTKWYGSTNMKLLDESSFLFHDTVVKRKPKEDDDGEAISSGLLLGTHWHEDIREHGPNGFERFADTVSIIPGKFTRADGSPSTSKQARDWFDRQLADSNKIVSQQNFDTLQLMDKRFRENMAAMVHETAPKDTILREVSIRWRCRGVPLKVRPDLISRGKLLDYKTTRDSNPARSFQRAVWKYKYHLSAVMYEMGCEAAGLASGPMHFVVTSTVGDCQTQVMTLSDEWLNRTKETFIPMLDDLNRRLEDNDWVPHGYGQVLTIGK